MPDAATLQIAPTLMLALGALALALGGAPLGVLLIDRRMSLVGDSLSHGILPGAAVAYLLAGPNPWALTLGALIAGFAVTGLATLIARSGRLRDDAAFAAVYLPSLALGVLILGRQANPETFETLLFGGVDNFDASTLILSIGAAVATLAGLVVLRRDPVHRPMLVMMLTALNLVAGFRAFGALMTVGLMMIPAAASGFWSTDFRGRAAAAVIVSSLSSAGGLIIARKFALEPGATMTLTAAALLLISGLFGPVRRQNPASPLDETP